MLAIMIFIIHLMSMIIDLFLFFSIVTYFIIALDFFELLSLSNFLQLSLMLALRTGHKFQKQ